jgi:hypothetical protein
MSISLKNGSASHSYTDGAIDGNISINAGGGSVQILEEDRQRLAAYLLQPDNGSSAAFEAQQRFFTASEDPAVVKLRMLIVSLGQAIIETVPDGRNKSLALTALEDVQMRGNRGIFATGPSA